jgi:NitT/TauT family transport system permease protein
VHSSPTPTRPLRRRPALVLTARRVLPLVVTPLAFAAAAVLAWAAAVRAFGVPAYLVPSPTALPHALPADLGTHVRVTATEVLLGFALANIVAFLAAILFVQSRILERGLYPMAIALKTTPLIAIAPLLVLWFGAGLLSKVVAAALISFFPMLVNSVRGLKAADADARELFAALRANRWHRFRRLELPASLPYVFAALKISSSLAVVGAIVGEFVGAREGLGFIILQSSYNFQTAQLFATIIVAAFLGFAIFAAISVIESLVCTWERVETL